MALRPEFDNPRFKQGLAVRREVLGAEYVDKSVQEAPDFMMAFQQMTTEWCWGETWTRGGWTARPAACSTSRCSPR